jgi:iron-sulfur cluster repair protein YtfE (RIC family)
MRSRRRERVGASPDKPVDDGGASVNGLSIWRLLVAVIGPRVVLGVKHALTGRDRPHVITSRTRTGETVKATELLKHQHDEVRTIFKQLLKGKDHSKELLEKLATSLSAHMVIEQELFYPAVLRVKEDLVLESYEEHAVARFALKRLMKTTTSDQTFDAKVATLKEIVEHHIQEEEEVLFPAAEKAVGESSSTSSQRI